MSDIELIELACRYLYDHWYCACRNPRLPVQPFDGCLLNRDLDRRLRAALARRRALRRIVTGEDVLGLVDSYLMGSDHSPVCFVDPGLTTFALHPDEVRQLEARRACRPSE